MKKEYKKIYKYCLDSTETDIIKLANKLMDLDFVPIHGPIHHYIVPSVLLTCYNNSVGGDKETLSAMLKEAAKRAKIVPGANCANCGACGAALGFGQFASIITENSPLSTDSWQKVMQITSKCSIAIAENGGPRCCKRDVYLSLITGAKEIEEQLGIKLIAPTPMCKHFPKNNECRKQDCLYYPKKKNKEN